MFPPPHNPSLNHALLFRIVYDRETGKPKGYGFCEYQDLETAQSAMRNLNDFDFHGRALRVSYSHTQMTSEIRVLVHTLSVRLRRKSNAIRCCV